MNIFESLREDHQKQRTLVNLLVKTKGASDGRKELFDRLKSEIEAHADAEERAFYKPLIDDDFTQDKTRHCIAEHKEIDDYIEQLEELKFDSSQWLPTAKKLKHKLIHHLDEEEHEVFQLAGKVLTENQKDKLADEYQDSYDEMKH